MSGPGLNGTPQQRQASKETPKATKVNRTELARNLGNDPEARFSAAGMKVVTASIAVHSSFKQGEEWKERTDWFRLVAFGEAGEHLASYRKGLKRSSLEVVVLRSDPAPLTRRAPAEAEP